MEFFINYSCKATYISNMKSKPLAMNINRLDTRKKNSI